ncbi:hypothetical protein MAR_007434 [Mya arenaria]|uniref:Uncharacterized protein n=1 Tax=Mya arenaria TaxID=6604 RepID=A0ABY7DFV1_MYAAR|nr:uncharacterized protein LOC128243742 [Mya arenaria]WAQ94963.1 hypothetical protein MAR_007434 [Mya arenaria]
MISISNSVKDILHVKMNESVNQSNESAGSEVIPIDSESYISLEGKKPIRIERDRGGVEEKQTTSANKANNLPAQQTQTPSFNVNLDQATKIKSPKRLTHFVLKPPQRELHENAELRQYLTPTKGTYFRGKRHTPEAKSKPKKSNNPITKLTSPKKQHITSAAKNYYKQCFMKEWSKTGVFINDELHKLVPITRSNPSDNIQGSGCIDRPPEAESFETQDETSLSDHLMQNNQTSISDFQMSKFSKRDQSYEGHFQDAPLNLSLKPMDLSWRPSINSTVESMEPRFYNNANVSPFRMGDQRSENNSATCQHDQSMEVQEIESENPPRPNSISSEMGQLDINVEDHFSKEPNSEQDKKVATITGQKPVLFHRSNLPPGALAIMQALGLSQNFQPDQMIQILSLLQNPEICVSLLGQAKQIQMLFLQTLLRANSSKSERGPLPIVQSSVTPVNEEIPNTKHEMVDSQSIPAVVYENPDRSDDVKSEMKLASDMPLASPTMPMSNQTVVPIPSLPDLNNLGLTESSGSLKETILDKSQKFLKDFFKKREKKD